ncbi:UbiH/UbiF/VisC/COQ6 family ubiquinone biosynthesis hydroxylase [Rhodobacter capsulatus]|jgi:2-octaprenyl-6-methoxyphenol hydroxylase|uniref:2-octaprenyl-3-methyl-6-methoxy-1,4-benzoquinol hydroxylase n=1 Tax=Rhodobacter capsulatus (strain ATCC BAA-309 / NBRC 16581 / SB1003) TaxID=272942 RepID=D5AS33_RHOCB|nr:UbiH/UbiF/VisC/COQ6 family ubiquinone biosynthesis hydroxylase [Rhodobacter capsulatus]ADE87055.1 2-octaprenyl-3-methyl-6-methoxy-1,4-benzoquinol hydroxylase [Rhodobacter capsulatus SB 1003]ETD00181.1 2-octaprenyl-6-methoxyphenyl hydroxylase [Rhodobacter capsulatus DE442]ETD74413.1 2-octaprenyl-6-methoxyphenyl hydroxylase [Rhodobacter capsulatus R121]ETE52247.1 2-octaprenyl-6-methoxyphenyl hydroxylase [Rhodobacter capsulatus Y262]MDS0928854.1 UbiH/UbiF/VisC/COQ6 family ubiquinone biosynthes
MTQVHDVLIAGGGLNGPALALALAGAGLSVTVIDAAPAQRRADDAFDGRAYALALASQKLLAALGLWPAVAAQAQPINDVKAFDGRPGEGAAPFFLHFDSRELDQKPVGYMLEDRFLYRAFLAAMQANPLITLISETSVVAQEVLPGSIRVTLSNGESLSGRVLIGADGRRSGVAERAGIGREGWGYGQTALVAALAHEKPHEGIAYQLFMPNGPLAILPLTGNRSSIVWSETDANAAVIATLSDDDFMELVRPRFGDFLGRISLVGPRFSYPLNLTLARAYAADRVALVGDAAHGVHPIAGQGLNLGLRDVAALAEVLIGAMRRGEDIGSIHTLERYQLWRRFDATTLALGMDTVNKLFSNDNPILRAGRDLGMGLVQAIGPLRRGFMRQAAGLAGPQPKLLQGRQI